MTVNDPENSQTDRDETARITPVILCGGSGTRLWPLSRATYPKPFVNMENGRTLFKDTLSRAARLPGADRPFIICNEDHRFYVLESLSQCAVEADIALEPAPRNTAPAIAIAALALREKGTPLMLAMPSDHVFGNAENFTEAVLRAAPLAASGCIVTFGIKPDKPETGYGYVERGEALEVPDSYLCRRFVEKPDAGRARAMLDQGGFFWNSGIFLMSPTTYLDELARFAPEIYESCLASWLLAKRDGFFIRPGADDFLRAPEDSIDYAVMERTSLAAVTALRSDWNDLGTWEAFYQAGTPDGRGNVSAGDVLLEDVENCYLHAEDRLLAAVGLRGLIVVESRDAVLVAPRSRAGDVKKIVERLKKDNRKEYSLPPIARRPWGSYESLALSDRYQVKHIIVKSGGCLSLQLHHHRAEHWIIVSGTAEVTVDGETRFFTENQSIYIPVGSRHKLRNPGIIPLELIEVQSGSYLGEDDIVRIEDSYGRV